MPRLAISLLAVLLSTAASAADLAYGARSHHAPLINRTVSDAKAHDYLSNSPYAFCADNPIRLTILIPESPMAQAYF